MTLGKQYKRHMRPQGELEKSLRAMIRSQGKADSTADCYWQWIEDFIRWTGKQRGELLHPKNYGRQEVERWLSMLANERRLASKSQNQAFSALCYLYRWIIKSPLENVSALRSKLPTGVRDVLDQSEVVALFANLSGVPLLCAKMMYGSSFRIGELGKLRIKDIHFERKQIIIRGAKGKKDRIVPFPESIHADVRRQIESMRVVWRNDVADGLTGVSLPDAYGRKCPSAHKDFAWWYLFSADSYSKCPYTGKLFRHHRDMDHVGRLIKSAAIKSGCAKRITSHNLRHSFCTHGLEIGAHPHVMQKIMGHADLETTMGYAHVSKDGITATKSPLDSLPSQPSPMIEALAHPRSTRTVNVSMSRLRVG
jgi:integron integrase